MTLTYTRFKILIYTGWGATVALLGLGYVAAH